MKSENILITPAELAQVVILQQDGTLSSTGAKRVVELLMERRLTDLTKVVMDSWAESGTEGSEEEARMVADIINWESITG